MSGHADVEKFILKMEAKTAKVFAESCVDFFGKVVYRTPVLTGTLISSWDLGFNFAPSDVKQKKYGVGNKLAEVQLKMSELRTRMKSVDGGDVVYFVNNQPYAVAIEYGSSAKAPQGVLGVSIVEWKYQVAANARKK